MCDVPAVGVSPSSRTLTPPPDDPHHPHRPTSHAGLCLRRSRRSGLQPLRHAARGTGVPRPAGGATTGGVSCARSPRTAALPLPASRWRLPPACGAPTRNWIGNVQGTMPTGGSLATARRRPPTVAIAKHVRDLCVGLLRRLRPADAARGECGGLSGGPRIPECHRTAVRAPADRRPHVLQLS